MLLTDCNAFWAHLQLHSITAKNRAYRSHINVGRILYRVATPPNIANDLLRNKLIKTVLL